MDGFPSGQRGQTVNLLALLSVVRIHPHPISDMFAALLAIRASFTSSHGANNEIYGVLAQLGEHLPYKQGVIGSSPIRPIFLKMLINMHNYMFLCRHAGYKVILYNIAG